MGKIKTQQSKTMSYILRYHCDEFNLEQDELGYVDINKFLEAIKTRIPCTCMEDIILHANTDNGRGRKRFEISEDSKKIRACYKYEK